MSLNGILIISTECKSECRPRAQALNPALGPLSWPSHLWSSQLCQGAGAGSPGPGPGSSPGLAHTCTMFASACLQWALEDRQGRDRPPRTEGACRERNPVVQGCLQVHLASRGSPACGCLSRMATSVPEILWGSHTWLALQEHCTACGRGASGGWAAVFPGLATVPGVGRGWGAGLSSFAESA